MGTAITHAGESRATYLPHVFDSSPVGDPAIRKLLANHPAWGMLREQERTMLLQYARVRVFGRHELVCWQGDISNYVILVLTGYVKLWCSSGDGDEVLLEIASPGCSAGEMTALQKQPFGVNVTSLSRCRLLLIDARQFRRVFESHLEGLATILQLASERLQRMTDKLVDSRSLTGPARLAKALIHLAQLPSSGFRGEPDQLLRFLSQGELGSMTGISREFVCRFLRVWRDAGWIRTLDGAVTSVQVADLARICADGAADRAVAGNFQNCFGSP